MRTVASAVAETKREGQTHDELDLCSTKKVTLHILHESNVIKSPDVDLFETE